MTHDIIPKGDVFQLAPSHTHTHTPTHVLVRHINLKIKGFFCATKLSDAVTKQYKMSHTDCVIAMNRLCTKNLNVLCRFLKHVLQSHRCQVTRVSEQWISPFTDIYRSSTNFTDIFMGKSRYREADSRLTFLETLCLLWNTTIHFSDI